ncbi:glycosyl hydrolases family 18-domain-containing protein [Hyaloraphidium curvatum]|nr:glycosyl hydrolases family 18-domain-containing protein [Hyaloraphidium curvatum]
MAPKKAVYYFPNWGIYGRAFPPARLPPHVRDVTYAFLDLKPDPAGNYVPTLTDAWADTDKRFTGPEEAVPPADSWNGPPDAYYGCLNQFRKMKLRDPGFRFGLSVGGWTMSAHFSDAVVSPKAREAFADSLVDMVARKFPGIVDTLDFDWEHISPEGKNFGNAGNVVRREDGANFVAFLCLLRQKLAAAGLSSIRLTVAVTAAPEKMSALPVEAMTPLIDEWRLMTYDFASSAWGPCNATHQTNLYPAPHTPYSISGAVDAYLARGVPPANILIGAVLYSRGFAGTAGLGKPSSGVTSRHSWEPGVTDYKALPVAGAAEHFDEQCKAGYCYDPAAKELFSYDTPRSIAEKCKYVWEKDLAGIIFWEASADAYDRPERALSRWAWELLESRDASLDKATRVAAAFAAGKPPILGPAPSWPSNPAPGPAPPAHLPVAAAAQPAAPAPAPAPVPPIPAPAPPGPQIPVAIPPGYGSAQAWSGAGVAYAVGAMVSYGGAVYECINAHRSQEDWMPGAAVSLWKAVG